jgi:hypothetical protein
MILFVLKKFIQRIDSLVPNAFKLPTFQHCTQWIKVRMRLS